MLRFSLPADRRVPDTRGEKSHFEGDTALEGGRDGTMDGRRGKTLSVPAMRKQALPRCSAMQQVQGRRQPRLKLFFVQMSFFTGHCEHRAADLKRETINLSRKTVINNIPVRPLS
jgi:hypothetical protein